MSSKETLNPSAGEVQWKEQREKWLSNKKDRKASRVGEVQAVQIDVDLVIEKVFSTKGDGKLPQPVPLGQMVDILVDFWEADGLYD
jgi:hypothetical protein